jgi:hypothetical protein
VVPSFNHFPTFEHDDFIGFFYGLKSVGYHYNGSSNEKILKSFCDTFFTKTIKRTRWFIEDNDMRIFEDKFCNREALFLSPTELHSSLPYLGIKSVRQIVDKLTVSKAHRFLYLG